jgi:hypothetical protein
MRERESKSAGPMIVGVILLVLALLSAYATGYFWLGDMGEDPFYATSPIPLPRDRYYQHAWQLTIFVPAAFVESTVIGRPVLLHHGATTADETTFFSFP